MTDPLDFSSATDLSDAIVIVGAGGHGCAIADVIRTTGRWNVLGFLDAEHTEANERYGLPLLGGDDRIEALVTRRCNLAIGVGQTRARSPRQAIFERLQALGASLPAIVSPHAYVSPRASLGPGVQVLHRAVVNADVTVGGNSIINSRALVEHEVRVGSGCHVSTGAIVNGRATIADRCFIGSGAVILQMVDISHDITIGAGAVVTAPLAAPGTYVGVPAKPLP